MLFEKTGKEKEVEAVLEAKGDSPNCDCWANNDAPIVADIGIFASADPVALDQACVDAVNAAPPIRGPRSPTNSIRARTKNSATDTRIPTGLQD